MSDFNIENKQNKKFKKMEYSLNNIDFYKYNQKDVIDQLLCSICNSVIQLPGIFFSLFLKFLKSNDNIMSTFILRILHWNILCKQK